MFIGLHVKQPLFSKYFNEPYILLTDFRKKFNIKFDENLPVGDELFHADGQTRRQT